MPRIDSIQNLEPIGLLDQEEWHPISPRYVTELRLRVLLTATPLLLMAGSGAVAAWGVVGYALSTALAIACLIVGAAWAPRRYRYTRYLRRSLDMNMQTGYWWRKTVSVAINRIQHLEISQGPIQRFLGLSTLVIYTAGSGQSDLRLPGLAEETAYQLKTSLLKQVAEEEELDEEALNGPSQ